MIVRVSGEGQFELPDADAERLNELDNRAVSAVDDGDETGFDELWREMLDLVASDGNALADDELVESDVILPPRDISFEEAQGGVHRRGADPGLAFIRLRHKNAPATAAARVSARRKSSPPSSPVGLATIDATTT